jgi:hypothetical protein
MTAKKPDADNIRRFLQELAQQEWIRDKERYYWPRFIFHYTDLPNAVSILQDEYIYSRNLSDRTGKLVTSSGSDKVLANTDETIKNYVRFYFRPKTPTQYWAEGIRSQTSFQTSSYRDAHCPVPIFFLFDSSEVLTRADCEFSDGNLANPKALRFSSADELKSLPWKKIYHNGKIDRKKADEQDIVFRRCAEVIVPQQIDLSSLRYIVCRSEAEKETLLHLLPGRLREQYAKQITATKRVDIFERKHTFVEKVRLFTDSMQFYFSPDTESPGPFNVQLDLLTNGVSYPYHATVDLAAMNYIYSLTLHRSLESYDIMLRLEQHIAYAGSFFDFSTIPF